MNEFDRRLTAAESNREKLAAAVRVIIFAALLTLSLTLKQHGAHHHPILSIALLYGALAFAGLLIAWSGFYHRLIAPVFVTLEVALIATQTVLTGALMGDTPLSQAALPVGTVIFVVLAHVAMRHRPILVLYAAALFLFMLLAAEFFIPDVATGAQPSHHLQHDLLHHRIFPIITLGLSAGILFVSANETRNVLRRSLADNLGRERLARFFAPETAQRLTDPEQDEIGSGAVQRISVLFADIRSFSAQAEQMSPEELTWMLTEFREELADTIQKYGGVVDKFIGDAVMAVFGFPETKDASFADRSLSCAMEMHKRVHAWSLERERSGALPVEIGIGIHYGPAFVGIVGSRRLLEFTAIGDTVNIAERVERLSRPLNADIVVTREFAEATSAKDWLTDWQLAADCELPGHGRNYDVFFTPRNSARSSGVVVDGTRNLEPGQT